MHKPRISTVGIQPKHPLHIIAIDTVDVTNMKMKYYNYIFSAMDIYTGFCWFFLMKKHEASDSVKSLKKIFEYSLRFRDPATRENMIEAGGGAGEKAAGDRRQSGHQHGKEICPSVQTLRPAKTQQQGRDGRGVAGQKAQHQKRQRREASD